MAEPTPDPAPAESPPGENRKARRREKRWTRIAVEAAAVSLIGVVVVGLLAYAGRREISRELAQAWLRERGLDAVISVDDLSASGFAGAIRIGPEHDPVFAADRIEVAYDLTLPWAGGPFAIDTKSVRLVRPRLKASLTDKGLNFGPLQALVDEVLKTPREPQAEGPSVLVENARVDLSTQGGLARITGDASLDDGKLLRFDGRLARMRYATDALVVEARGALVSARKRGERLTIKASFDLDSLLTEATELDDAQGQLDADLAYPDLTRLSAPGPAELRAVFTAASARLNDLRANAATGELSLSGQLDGDLAQARFTGRATGRLRGDELTGPSLAARGAQAQFDLPSLALARQGDRLAAQARGHLTADASQALVGGTALRGASARLDTSGLILSTDQAGGALSGPVAVQLGVNRLAAGSLALTSLAVNAKGKVSGAPNAPGLVLEGSAGADSGVSGPDAERLTAALPSPAYAAAGAKALRTFDLSAPALRLTVQNGRTILALPRPAALASADGGKIEILAPGGVLADIAGGSGRGALALRMTGGGLPNLTLDAPDWRMTNGAIGARLTLAGQDLDIPPIEGLSGKLAGQARIAGGRFDFALAGCTPLTGKRVLMGETPLSAPKAELCPDKAPLVAVADGRWAAAARFKALSVGLDEAEAKADDIAGSLTASGADGQMRAEVRLDQGVLSDAAATRRFNPLRASGRLGLSNGIWSGTIDAKTPVGQPLGRITLRHDVAQARGRAELDASNLVFAKDGLQPVDLSPMAAFAKQASGKAAFTGLFVWDADGMTSNGRVVADKIDFTSPIGFVATLDGKVDFVSLAPLVSAPDQSLKIVRVDSIVPLEKFGAVFALGADSLHISSAAFEAAKGRISIEPTEVPLDPQKPIKGVIVVEHLDLGELIAASSLVEKVQLDAVVDGRLPFEFGPKGFKFLDGKVAAIKPGRVQISRAALSNVSADSAANDSPGAPTAAAPPVNAIQDFAYQAMENLSFDEMEARVNSTDNGRLSILFHIKGEHDPKTPEKARVGLLDLLRGSAFNKRIALPAKTPVDLTLDTSLNFDELMAAWRRSFAEEVESSPASRSVPVQP